MFHITEEIILPNNIELKFPSSKVGAKSIFEGIVRDNNLGKSVGFLGFDGGKLKKICNHSLVVKSEKGLYGPVEDLHLVINHLISLWLQAR